MSKRELKYWASAVLSVVIEVAPDVNDAFLFDWFDMLRGAELAEHPLHQDRANLPPLDPAGSVPFADR